MSVIMNNHLSGTTEIFKLIQTDETSLSIKNGYKKYVVNI